MGRERVTWLQLKQGLSIPIDEQHTLVIERNYADVIELGEAQLITSSSLLRPSPALEPASPKLQALSGLSVIAHALRYAKEHPDRKLAVLAHDSDRDVGVALVRSQRRAQNVHAVLTGDKAAFARSCWYAGAEVPLALLEWAHARFRYDCQPVARSGQTEAERRRALEDGVRRFRAAHNARTGVEVPLAGPFAQADHQAFAELFDLALAELLEVKVDALASFRSALVFCAPAQLGCGNRWNVPAGPDAQHLVNASTCRVDLTFFETAVAIPDLRAAPPGVRIYADRRHARCIYVAPEPPPPVICVRMTGMYFDSNKCFLLPSAMRGLRKLVALYDEDANAELLIIGHTDTAGRPAYNDQLSLERAKAVAAFLKDDFGVWLEWYGASKPQLKRWGVGEDLAMLTQIDAGAHLGASDPIRSYQAARGLDVDGIAGNDTRTQLIKDYMALDGTTLPASITPVVHGCGESFPEIETDDEVEEDRNRRVELLMFGEGIDPSPPGELSKPGSEQYGKWRAKVVRTYENETRVKRDFDFVWRINRDVDTHDDFGFCLDGPEGELMRLMPGDEGVADDLKTKLRRFSFRDVPLGNYAVFQVFDDMRVCTMIDLVVAPDGVYLHGRPLAQHGQFTPSKPLPIAQVQGTDEDLTNYC